MQRKLVSVQVVEKLEAIAGADFIEKAIVMGWSLVVKKGEFEEGDKCAFFEIDSVLPESDWAEFMRPSKFRVRTKKMKGVLSQGLALPLSLSFLRDHYWIIGDDLTGFCGVTKHEPSLSKDFDNGVLAPFPAFIPKTNEIRIQSALGVLEELKGKEIYATVKLDGTSATYAKSNGEFYTCSRNNQLKPSDNWYWQIADKYNLADLPEGYAVQGEICGEGIQKNRLGLKGKDFFVFNVFNIREGRYLGFDEYLRFCDRLHLKRVPIQNLSTLCNSSTVEFDHTLEDLLLLADGFYNGTKSPREGIVIRPIEEVYSKTLNGRLSIKVISNRYLLKGGED